jgi:hypothetical protein
MKRKGCTSAGDQALTFVLSSATLRMRSQAALIRQSRVLLASAARSPTSAPRSFNSTAARRLPRKPKAGAHPARTYRHASASQASSSEPAPAPSQTNVEAVAPTEAASDAPDAGPAPPPPEEPEPEPEPELEKPRRKPRAAKESANAPLPPGLRVLWTADSAAPPPNPNALPPAPLLDEVLHHVHVALHPQAQRGEVEPTLGLYCPLEGGEYVVDETVRELARRTGADVVVLDAVQLAAGEHGQFGKGESLSSSRPAADIRLPNRSEYTPAARQPATLSVRALLPFLVLREQIVSAHGHESGLRRRRRRRHVRSVRRARTHDDPCLEPAHRHQHRRHAEPRRPHVPRHERAQRVRVTAKGLFRRARQRRRRYIHIHIH